MELDNLVERKKLDWIQQHNELQEKLTKTGASRQSIKLALENKELEV